MTSLLEVPLLFNATNMPLPYVTALHWFPTVLVALVQTFPGKVEIASELPLNARPYPSVIALGVDDEPVGFPSRLEAARDGRSAFTRARNVGTPEDPEEGPAKTVFVASFASVAERVPALVTGLPDTVNIEGSESATEDTDPLPAPEATPPHA